MILAFRDPNGSLNPSKRYGFELAGMTFLPILFTPLFNENRAKEAVG